MELVELGFTSSRRQSADPDEAMIQAFFCQHEFVALCKDVRCAQTSKQSFLQEWA
jgi:hypothetical protein